MKSKTTFFTKLTIFVEQMYYYLLYYQYGWLMKTVKWNRMAMDIKHLSLLFVSFIENDNIELWFDDVKSFLSFRFAALPCAHWNILPNFDWLVIVSFCVTSPFRTHFFTVKWFGHKLSFCVRIISLGNDRMKNCVRVTS